MLQYWFASSQCKRQRITFVIRNETFYIRTPIGYRQRGALFSGGVFPVFSPSDLVGHLKFRIPANRFFRKRWIAAGRMLLFSSVVCSKS